MREDMTFKAISLSGETIDIPVISYNGAKAELDISNLPKGIYVLKIQSEDQLITRK